MQQVHAQIATHRKEGSSSSARHLCFYRSTSRERPMETEVSFREEKNHRTRRPGSNFDGKIVRMDRVNLSTAVWLSRSQIAQTDMKSRLEQVKSDTKNTMKVRWKVFDRLQARPSFSPLQLRQQAENDCRLLQQEIDKTRPNRTSEHYPSKRHPTVPITLDINLQY